MIINYFLIKLTYNECQKCWRIREVNHI